MAESSGIPWTPIVIGVGALALAYPVFMLVRSFTGLTDTVTDTVDTLVEGAGALLGGAADGLEAIGDGIGSGVEAVGDGISTGVGAVGDGIGAVASGIGSIFGF